MSFTQHLRILTDHVNRFIYWLYLCQDANFRSRNGMVSSDERDPTLGQGWSYFVEKGEYVKHIKTAVEADEVRILSILTEWLLIMLSD